MFGFLNMSSEHARQVELRDQHKTAKDLGKKKCVKCGWCCKKVPCNATPEELKNIAKNLKIDIVDFIKEYYVITRFMAGDPLYIRFIGHKQKDIAGKYESSERTFNRGFCIFLDENNKCKIHKLKPKDARDAKCWIDYNMDLSKWSEDHWPEGTLEKEFPEFADVDEWED